MDPNLHPIPQPPGGLVSAMIQSSLINVNPGLHHMDSGQPNTGVVPAVNPIPISQANLDLATLAMPPHHHQPSAQQQLQHQLQESHAQSSHQPPVSQNPVMDSKNDIAAAGLDHQETKPVIHNPWQVANLMVFSYFCCPECDYKCQAASKFQDHAMHNHPLAKDFFDGGTVPMNVNGSISASVQTDTTMHEFAAIKNELDQVLEYSNGEDRSSRRRSRKSHMGDDSYQLDDFVVDNDDDGDYFEDYYDYDYELPPKKKRKRKSRESKVVKEEFDESGLFDNDNDDEEFLPEPDVNVKVEGGGDENEDSMENSDDDTDGNDVKPHACSMCPEKYKGLYGLAMHLLCIHDVGMKGAYPCPACEYAGSTMVHVKKHIREYHEAGKKWTPKESKPSTSSARSSFSQAAYGIEVILPDHQCGECDAIVKGMCALAKHLRSAHGHGGKGSYECPKCDYKGETWLVLRKHIQKNHEKGMVKCPTCGKEVIKTSLYLHIKNVHQSDKVNKPYICEREGCKYRTHTESNLKEHIKHKHDTHKHKFKCDICEKTFLYKATYEQHMEQVHMDLRRFVCDKCGRNFRHNHELKKHLEQPSCNFMTARDKIYSCDQCDEEYPTMKSYIFHHRKTHGCFPANVEAGQLHLCDQCPGIYLSVAGLKRHKEADHLGKPRGPRKSNKEKCPYCERYINKGVNLKEHILSKHEKNTPYKCDQCSKAYGTEAYLRTHITNTHRREKCTICGQEICNKLWLKRHMSKVHGVKPDNEFACEFCPLIFCTQISREKHMIKQHA